MLKNIYELPKSNGSIANSNGSRIHSNGSIAQLNDFKLDIGCGFNKKDGFIGIDRSNNVGADYVLDIEREQFPFDDSSVSEIYCAHLVEHLSDLISFMNECYRVLKPDGLMTILAPYYTAIQASQDPTHVRYINERTFCYFTDEYLGNGATFEYGINSKFEIESTSYTYINLWAKPWIPTRVRRWARHHLFNVAVDITVIMKAVK
ncbi:methyltransferase domain-containing protein [bacterium]|nr:methyltransferase domain-containing protein [bacterium]